MNLHPHFHFSSFPERERERERAQIGEHWSMSGAIVRRARSSIDQWRDWRVVRPSNEHACRSRSSIVVTRCDRLRSTAWSHRSSINKRCDRAVDRDLDDRGAIAPSFFWVCLVCLFLLLLQTPKNIFQKIFWNVTKHMKIFSFPENSIFEKWNIFRKCFYTNQTQLNAKHSKILSLPKEARQLLKQISYFWPKISERLTLIHYLWLVIHFLDSC